MSHWTIARTQIRNPDLNLLREALAVIAEELGARLVEDATVIGWRHREHVDFLVEMELPYGNGYGVRIDSDGSVKVFVDTHGAPLTSSEFTAKLNQYYIALALSQIAQQEGFNINMSETSEGILIELVR